MPNKASIVSTWRGRAAISTKNMWGYRHFSRPYDFRHYLGLLAEQRQGKGTFTKVTDANNPFDDLTNKGGFYNDAQKAFVADWDNDKDVDVLVTSRINVDKNIFYKQNGIPPILSSTYNWSYGV